MVDYIRSGMFKVLSLKDFFFTTGNIPTVASYHLIHFLVKY